jgi:hypothetical protein
LEPGVLPRPGRRVIGISQDRGPTCGLGAVARGGVVQDPLEQPEGVFVRDQMVTFSDVKFTVSYRQPLPQFATCATHVSGSMFSLDASNAGPPPDLV